MATENDLVNEVINSANTQINQEQEAKDAISALLQKRQQAQQDQEVQASKEGIMLGNGEVITPETQQVKDLATLKQQSQVNEVATHLGSNPDDAASILTGLADEWKNATVRSVKSAKMVSDKESSKFFDSPLQFVYDRLTLPFAKEQADADTAYRNNVSTSLQQAQQLTQELPKTMAAIAQTETSATAQSKLEAVQARIQSNIDSLKIKNASTDIDGLKTLVQMGQDQLNSVIQKFSAYNQSQHLQLAQASFALEKQKTEAMLAEHEQKMADKTATEQESKDFADYAKKGASILGFDNVAQLPHNRIIQLYNAKDPMIHKMINVGIMSTLNGGKPTISDNPGEVAGTLALTNAPLAPIQENIKKFFKSVWGDAANPNNATKNKISDVSKMDQVSAAAGRLATQGAQTQLGNIKTGDNTNIYAPPPLPNIVGLKAVQDTSLYQTVLKDQIAAGGLKEFQPDQIISMAVSGFKTGKYDYKTMSKDLLSIFGGVAAYNNTLHNYTGFGLPAQTTYNTEVGDNFGYASIKNLANSKDLDNVLNNKLSKGTFRIFD